MDTRWNRLKELIRTSDKRVRIAAGVALIILGLLALVTPLTPGSWLIFIGFELLGIRILAWPKIVAWVRRRREKKSIEDVQEGL